MGKPQESAKSHTCLHVVSLSMTVALLCAVIYVILEQTRISARFDELQTKNSGQQLTDYPQWQDGPSVSQPDISHQRYKRSTKEDTCKTCKKEIKKLKKRVHNIQRTSSRQIGRFQGELDEIIAILDSSRHGSKVQTGHFFASVDPKLVFETYTRQEPIQTDIGALTPDGLIPEGQQYKFWNVSEWTNDVFEYNNATGVVTVHTTGIYLIYVQVVYHDLTNRNSFGIYINHESEPTAQCLAFDVPTGNHRVRHGNDGTREENYTYQQCDTMAVRQLQENGKIFIKGAYVNRTLVARPPLTFWEIVKLG